MDLYKITPTRLIKKFIKIIRSKWLSKKIDSGRGCFIIGDYDLRVAIKKGKNAKIIINGRCKIQSWLGGKTPVNIYVDDNAKLTIDGNFDIGHGVMIFVGKGGELWIGGSIDDSGSGITCDTKILVNKNVNIGRDFICAWDVFITDSDWHLIEGQLSTRNVDIADHVWIANNSSILKGTYIGKGCIVASHSKLSGDIYPDNSLIGGVPAKVIKNSVKWHKDM